MMYRLNKNEKEFLMFVMRNGANIGPYKMPGAARE